MNAPEPRTALAVQPPTFDLSPRTFEQALTFAGYLAESDLVPKDFRGKPGNCLIGMQWGAELGLKALQALQGIAVINGRPNLWGDAMLAIVRASPLCEYVVEGWEADGTAFCKAKRRGEPEQIRTFSDHDAKLAGLLGKQGPWQQSPKRMKQLRARAFALRDVFTDLLRGMHMAEESADIPPPAERHMGAVEEVAPPAAPARPELPARTCRRGRSWWPTARRRPATCWRCSRRKRPFQTPSGSRSFRLKGLRKRRRPTRLLLNLRLRSAQNNDAALNVH